MNEQEGLGQRERERENCGQRDKRSRWIDGQEIYGWSRERLIIEKEATQRDKADGPDR